MFRARARGELRIALLAMFSAACPIGNLQRDDSAYADIGDRSKWATYDVTQASSAVGPFAGAAFDGRYVYFAPQKNGLVLRYDTQGELAAVSSWKTFDATSVSARAAGFMGAAFDGRYVYFAPNSDGVALQYDSRATFTTGSSWSTFDVTTLDSRATGYAGAVFDGRFIYFVPDGSVTVKSGLVARYDTKASFSRSGSWLTFDMTSVASNAVAYTGAVFDGRYVYLVPRTNAGVLGGLVARYDTLAAFGAGSSWTMFEMPGGHVGYTGGAFNGRYVYFVPGYVDGTPEGAVAAYDTLADFATPSSWSFFDTTSLGAGGFAGGAFDGRYLYLTPFGGGYGVTGARYDTEAPFEAGPSWSAFDTSVLASSPKVGSSASVFDGRYVYFMTTSDYVVRFDAKSPPSLPPGPAHGSFF